MSAVVLSAVVRAANAGGARTPAARVLQGQLEGLRRVIDGLPAAVYGAAPSRASGTIGAHVRHCLDHVRAVVATRPGPELSYDSRLRGTTVETDPEAAVEEIDRLCLELEEIPPSRVTDTVRLRSQVERSGATVVVQSTIGRELAFVIQHTIHHAAIIGVLLDQLGVRVPDDFGYAPSTPLVVHDGTSQLPTSNSQLPTPNSQSEPLVRAG